MSSRYLPPHLRNQTPSSSSPPPPARDPSSGYTLDEIAHQFSCKHKVGTLNGNSEIGVDWNHSHLAFILIFKDQHPQWPPKIFCKTNLNLLPATAGAAATADDDDGGKDGVDGEQGDDEDAHTGHQDGAEISQPLGGPIPVFIENPTQSFTPGVRSEKRYVLTSHHRITSVTYLAPQGKELIQMLNTKFSPERKMRSAEAWRHSLEQRWAVVELEVVDDAGMGHPMVPLREVKRMGVRERLEQLRMGEGGVDGGQGVREGKRERAAWGKDESGRNNGDGGSRASGDGIGGSGEAGESGVDDKVKAGDVDG